MEGKAITGYPSIDRPQEKYYRSNPVKQIKTDQSVYDLVFSSNKDKMDSFALSYLGTEFTYRELKEKVDALARAFMISGFTIGDTVLMGLSNTPEAIIASLALNRIGCIQRWFDIRVNEKILSDYIRMSKCKCFITIDMLVPIIRNILDTTELENVLVVHPSSCLSSAKKALYSVKFRKQIKELQYNDRRIQEFWDFVHKGENQQIDLPNIPFDKNRPSVMIQSSGTTGKPKTIVHSDFSATSAINSLSYSDLPISKGKTVLNLLPPWIAYGLGEAIIYPLTMGSKVILSPTFDPDAIMPYIGEFTIAIAAPFHYRYLREHFDQLSQKKQERFFSMIEGLISGGDKITVQENQKFEEVFKTTLVNGYGDNEGWGCLTVNPIKNNRYGSVGIPKYGETIISFDNETGEELPYGEVGEICARCNTLFLQYDQDNEETQKVKKIHNDGTVWLHTGDLGYIDSDGYVFLSGRARRVIIRQGFKISAYTIEDKICELPEVKECVAVEAPDKLEEHVPVVFVIIDESSGMDHKTAEERIKEKCKSELKDYEIPKHICILEKMPYTANGKYDFRNLERNAIELFSE